MQRILKKTMTWESNPHSSLRETPPPAESGIGELMDEVPQASLKPETSRVSRRSTVMLMRLADSCGTFGHIRVICRIRVEQRVASPLLRGRAFLFFPFC